MNDPVNDQQQPPVQPAPQQPPVETPLTTPLPPSMRPQPFAGYTPSADLQNIRPANSSQPTSQPPQPTAPSSGWAADPLLTLGADVPSADVQPAVTAVPATFGTAMAMPQMMPVSQTGIVKARSPKKSLIIGGIVGGLLMLLGAGSALAYTIYSTPENVLADAMQKSMAAQTVEMKGQFVSEGESNNVSGKATLDFTSASTVDAFKFDGKLTGTMENESLPDGTVKIELDASLIGTADQQTYGKIGNLDGLADTLLSDANQAEMREAVQPIIDIVDDQWIKFPADDLSTEETCAQDVLRTYSTSASQQSQVKDAYLKNPFIEIKENKGFETIQNRSSAHYLLVFNEEVAQSFFDAVKQTDLYVELIKCDKETYDTSRDDVSDMVETLNDNTVEVWIDRWNHEFTRLAISGDIGDEMTYRFGIEPTFNRQVTITAPEGAKDFNEVMKAVEETYNELFYGNDQAVMRTGENYDQDAYNRTAMEAQLQARQLADCQTPAKKNTTACRRLTSQVQGAQTPAEFRQSDLLNLLYL